MEWHQPTFSLIHMTKEWSRVRYRPSGMIIGRVLHFTPNQEPGADTSKVAIAAVDTLLWQALASVIVPGFSHHHNISVADHWPASILGQDSCHRSLKLTNSSSGFTINRICWGAGLGLAKALPGVAVTARNWMVTGLGLGVIPLIIHPIDKWAVEFVE